MTTTLRQSLVDATLAWEEHFANAPAITGALAEYDAARALGMSEADYSKAMQGATAVQKGVDFKFKGKRYQVKGNRPSGKRGSKVTLVRKAANYDWDFLIWVLYDREYNVLEAWQWTCANYEKAFNEVARLSPDDMRRGRNLLAK